eukprot:jgi/Ulvmu1/1766/UM118_0005.1
MEERLAIEAFPDSPLVVVRLKNVDNAEDVRKAIVGKTLPCDAAFVDAEALPDIFLLHLAAFKALAAQKAGKQVTHSLHADVVYNLAGSRHIAAALNTFGITKSTSDLLIARFAATDEELQQLVAEVKGERVPVLEGGFASEQAVRKLFKCGDAELKIGTVLDSAICKGALLPC